MDNLDFLQHQLNQIIWGKWEQILPLIPDHTVDLILTDPPYNITHNKWDQIPVDLDKLWVELKRVAKPGTPFVFTAAQPFTTDLINSNRGWLKYCDVWDKRHPVGHLNKNVMPLRRHEDIVIFGGNTITYNPVMRKGKSRVKGGYGYLPNKGNYGEHARNKPEYTNDEYYPTSILEIPRMDRKNFHPTQKPVELFEHLIRLYSNPGEIVLDPFAGSCTTAEAAHKTGRKFICVEELEKFVNYGKKRMEKIYQAPTLTGMEPDKIETLSQTQLTLDLAG